MGYREIKRLVRIAAAGHLYSLEIHDEFPKEDEDRVDRAIREIQAEILGQGISKQRRAEQALSQQVAPRPGLPPSGPASQPVGKMFGPAGD